MVTKKPVYYAGAPDNCDVCDKPFGNMMFDAATAFGGWGNLCQACFNRYGKGIGQGKGQRYNKQDNGCWLKTGG